MASVRWIGRRLADLGSGLVDVFLRGNRVLPPVLAVMALFVFAWLLAGAFLGGSDQKPVAHKADLAQSDGGAPAPDPVSPGVENRDVNSYAAYRSKDPFREVLAPAKTTQEQASSRPEDTTGAGRRQRGSSAGARDTDRDGIPDRRERNIPSDPNNPDTDGDGIPDGADANNDGRPDGGAGGAPGGRERTAGQGGDLFKSGGILPLP